MSKIKRASLGRRDYTATPGTPIGIGITEIAIEIAEPLMAQLISASRGNCSRA